MNAPPARAQAREIQRSLHCFILGGLGLLPVIGFPLALLALMAFRRVCVENRGRWNPARAYLIWGFVLGSIGVLLSFGAFYIVFMSVAGQFASLPSMQFPCCRRNMEVAGTLALCMVRRAAVKAPEGKRTEDACARLDTW